jgi:peptide-methionine (S)-S-oxide reductase
MKKEIAVFAGGCFWCTEAVFNILKGIISAKPGYTGGTVANPTYEQVSSEKTGHAEAIHIEFNADEIGYKDLLTVFFASHDPTQLNRQGADIGEQYRSAIFYSNDDQKKVADEYIEELKMGGLPVVTKLEEFTKFYEAEDYHKNYFEKNKNERYSKAIITPKLEKVQRRFQDLLKENRK